MEYLDRGTVAVGRSSAAYISWRLLGTENYDTVFDIYRDGEKIAEVSDSTNYTDTECGSSYAVFPSGTQYNPNEAVEVWDTQYLEIPLNTPKGGTDADGNEYSYSANDASCADLDGDGQYEIILKWEPSNGFDSGKDAKQSSNVYIDAYKLDGTQLWRIDLGHNINAGAHFNPFAVYDFDLDGCAELVMKTAPGTVDGIGKFVSEASLDENIRSTDNTADYRYNEVTGASTGGRVLAGDEYYTVFDGISGAALDTIYYPYQRGTIIEWGDNWGNRSERYLCAAAYLDGVTPSVIAWRGYYAKTTAAAYNLVDKRLVRIAEFDTSTEENSVYAGNGNHNLTVADVDGDGCDEIFCGSLALDNDLSVLWCSGRGHGDALHLADYDPTYDGMEYFSVHEDYNTSRIISGSTTGNNGKNIDGGMTLYDAATGEELFHQSADYDVARGMMANVGFSGGYFDFWGCGNYSSFGGNSIYNGDFYPDSANQRLYWNEDTYDELFDGTGSSDTGSQGKISGKDGRIFSIRNAVTNNGSKNNPCLIADILGDWREEILLRSPDSSSLLLYTTVIPTGHKMYNLMQNSAYRMQVAAQNAGYNQPPHIDYYISEENNEYDGRKYADYIKTVHNGVEAVRTENLPEDKPQVIAPIITPSPTPTIKPTARPTVQPTLAPDITASPTPTPIPEFVIEDGVLTEYHGNCGEVVIPEEFNGMAITAIGDNAFEDDHDITKITIPECVTSIGKSSFSGCTGLISAEILGAVEFDDFVFYGDTSLEDVSIGEGTTDLGTCTFNECSSLKKLVLPLSIETISSAGGREWLGTSEDFEVWGYAGSYAEKYFTETFPRVFHYLNTTISENGFTLREDGIITGYDGSKTDIVIPETIAGIKVSGISSTAFAENHSITSIYIPDGAVQLSTGLFEGCTELKSVRLPADSTLIPKRIFYGCEALESVEIPENVTEIGERAFAYCSLLRNIELPPSLKEINAQAFTGCKGLTRVTIPESVTTIDTNCFNSCSSLEGIEINAKITSIPYRMFYNCTSLKEIKIPEGTQIIYGSAFEGCTSLERAVIPSSVVIAVSSSFKKCDNLTIYGESGAYTEQYASENDIPFVSTGKFNPSPTKEPLPDSGSIRIRDTKYKDEIISARITGTRNGIFVAVTYDRNGRLNSVRLVSDDRWIMTEDGCEIYVEYDDMTEYLMLFDKTSGEPLCKKQKYTRRSGAICAPYPQSTPPPDSVPTLPPASLLD